MKTKSTIIALLMFIATTGIAQITKQQAIDYVMDSIVVNRANSVNVFMDSLLQTSSYYNLNAYDSIQSPYSNYWLFFIDEQPEYSWGHECNYVFINQINGNDSIIQKQAPPFQYENKLQEVSIEFSFTIQEPNVSIPGPTYNENNDNCNLYAVLINNFPTAIWSHLSHLYTALREAGYPEENIYVLSNDGTINTNKILNLDNVGGNDILNKECCSTNVAALFNDLKEIIGPDDMLFVYTYTMQQKYPSAPDDIELILWDGPLEDNLYADMIEQINCSRLIFSASNGYSGGIGDDIENMNNLSRKTVLTSTDWVHNRHVSLNFRDLTGMVEYDFWLITALRGYYPDYYKNAPWVAWEAIGDLSESEFSDLSDLDEINFDDESNEGNGDGIYQINETIEYVKRFDRKITGHTESQFEEWGTKTYNNAFATEDLLSLHGISGRVEYTHSLSGSFIIGGPLFIEKGVELTLDNTTIFNVFKTFIGIKPGIIGAYKSTPGGKLIANGATLTNACTSAWEGIQVCGNEYHQFTLPDHVQTMGRLILDEATIENAEVAFKNNLYIENYDEFNGGIINAKQTTFNNNTIALMFKGYRNIYDGDEYDYVSSFTNCSFVIDENYFDENGYEFAQVKMDGVRGIRFKGCTFTNVLGSAPSGVAIESIGAGFFVDEGCRDPDIQPCDIISSKFNGFMHAIEASNNYPNNIVSIRNSKFENNGIGINLKAVKYAVITDNTFNLGEDGGCRGDAATGIFLDNSHSFAIEDNTFTIDNHQTGTDYYGIDISNTNNPGDEVYANTFNGLTYGNFAEGKNWNVSISRGLAYYCNENTGNTNDFFVSYLEEIEGDGIQSIQGSDSKVTGNTFSTNATMHFDNNGDHEVFYYYDLSSGSETPSGTKLDYVDPEPINLSNTCPTHYGGGDEIKLTSTEYNQKESDYSSALSTYNTSLNKYNGTSDSALKKQYLEDMSYYNTLMNHAAYDIIRSNLCDTIAHDSLYMVWQGKLDTYTTAENMVDYYISMGEYVTAMHKVDSLPINFTFSAYDSTEYDYYYDLKAMQTAWLDSERDIFSLTTTEISDLETIADSSRGTGGAQARGILNFILDTVYFYTNCPALPDTSNKSGRYFQETENTSESTPVTIHPNPAQNSFRINYKLEDEAEQAIFELYNQQGILIDQIILNQSEKIKIYDCSNLLNGMYYYWVYHKNKRSTGKILIVR